MLFLVLAQERCKALAAIGGDVGTSRDWGMNIAKPLLVHIIPTELASDKNFPLPMIILSHFHFSTRYMHSNKP